MPIKDLNKVISVFFFEHLFSIANNHIVIPIIVYVIGMEIIYKI
jgi:hypothetical protein